MPSLRVGGWYIKRLYAHFDQPMSFANAERFVRDAHAVAQHGFLPFIAFDDVVRRFRKDPGSPTPTPSTKEPPTQTLQPP
jgi:hypothetical protein